MKNEWDEYAHEWDKDPSVKEYALKVLSELNNKIQLEELTILDFGCGTGNLTELLSPTVKQIVALDGSREMMKLLEEKELDNVSIISDFLCDELINNHPYLDQKFDLIIASSVCSFLPDYEASLGQLKSLLTSGGLFIQFDWLAQDEGASMGLTKQRIQTCLEAHKFKQITIEVPFAMTSSKGSMDVVMAYGTNI